MYGWGMHFHYYDSLFLGGLLQHSQHTHTQLQHSYIHCPVWVISKVGSMEIYGPLVCVVAAWWWCRWWWCWRMSVFGQDVSRMSNVTGGSGTLSSDLIFLHKCTEQSDFINQNLPRWWRPVQLNCPLLESCTKVLEIALFECGIVQQIVDFRFCLKSTLE